MIRPFPRALVWFRARRDRSERLPLPKFGELPQMPAPWRPTEGSICLDPPCS